MNTSILCKFGNTGVQGCALDADQIQGVIILPRNVSLNLPAYSTDALLIAAMNTATLAADSLRIRPYLFGVDFVDNTAEAAKEVAGFGRTVGVTHANPSYQMQLDHRGIEQIQEFYKLESNKGNSVIFYDKSRTLWGKIDSAGKLFGWPCDINVIYKHATGSAKPEKKVNFELHDKDAFLNGTTTGYFRFDESTYLQDVVSGVHPVKLSVVSAAAATIVVKADLVANLVSLGESWEVGMELPAAWSLVLNSTGAAVTITSVTYSATAKTFTLAGTFTLAAHTLNLVTPAALYALATPVGDLATGGFQATAITVTPA